jgi:hypothetical protein
MKWLFIFLLSLPLCSAIAVSPPQLDKGQFVVINNLERSAKYKLIEDGKVKQQVVLKPKEKHLFKVTTGDVEVEEQALGSNIINSFSFKHADNRSLPKDYYKIFIYAVLPLVLVVAAMFLLL